MKKLALSDDILLKIEKPARYLGNEVNHVVKDPEGKIRFAMGFPDVYEIGMSHLGRMCTVNVCILHGWIWMK